MARREPEYGYPSLEETIDFARTSSCSYLEILHYSGLPEPVHREGSLSDEATVLGWLSKDLSLPNSTFNSVTTSSNQQMPLGGIRILFGVCGFNPVQGCQTIPFKEESFAALKEILHVPKQFEKIMIGRIARAFTFSSHGSYENSMSCFVLKQGIYRPGYYQLALSYNRLSRITHGLILAKTKDHEFPKLIHELKEHKMHCQQPLLLAVLVTDLVIDSCEERIHSFNRKLDDLDEVMGQHEYVNRPKGNPLEIDFIATTSILNAFSRYIAAESLRAGALLPALRSMLDISKTITTESRSDLVMVEELIAYQINACHNLLLKTEYVTKRAQTQIAVVYQFMAQKDAKVNIELAKDTAALARLSKEDSQVMKAIAIETKKDSSAMKTIAILTMTFLPGTFLAALFAMPLFDWDVNNGAPTVHNGFKYYCAMAIPLTFLVFLLWLLAMVLPWRAWLSKLHHEFSP